MVAAWPFDHKMAVNYATLALRGAMDSFCTLHPGIGQALRQLAFEADANCDKNKFVPMHSKADIATADLTWPFRSYRGTSGLFGTKVAVAWGFDRIVLAGLPFTDTGHFYDPPGTTLERGDLFLDLPKELGMWRRCQELFGDRIRSLSGWTAEVFGKPTREWFDGK